MKYFIASIFILTSLLLGGVAVLNAAPIAGEQGLLTLANKGCVEFGNCTLCDAVAIVNNVIRLILGLTGGLALVAFLYGGFQLMFKGTEWKAMSKGKDTMVYALIGLFLVFFSFAIVNFGINLIVVASGNKGEVNFSSAAKLFGSQNAWNEICAPASAPAPAAK